MNIEEIDFQVILNIVSTDVAHLTHLKLTVNPMLYLMKGTQSRPMEVRKNNPTLHSGKRNLRNFEKYS